MPDLRVKKYLLKTALDKELYEDMAAVQHEIWSSWMVYMFDQGTMNDDGTWTMPADKVERWQRQMYTDYDKLSGGEQDSDREQVEKLWPLIIKWLADTATNIMKFGQIVRGPNGEIR